MRVLSTPISRTDTGGICIIPVKMGSFITNAMQALSSRIVNALTSNPTASLIYVILTTTVALSLWTKTTRRASGLPLPPQPPSKPILGHLTDLIRENQARRWHLKLEGWAREYGAIFGVRTGYIVDYYINSDVLAKVSLSLLWTDRRNPQGACVSFGNGYCARRPEFLTKETGAF